MPDISKVALIIGVDSYHHKNFDRAQSLQPLHSCKKDALDLYKLLKDYEYTIFGDAPIIGSNIPEGEGYKKILEKTKIFFEKAEAGQTLIFYFSGHGITNRGGVYLATPEVDPQSPKFIGLNLIDLSDLIDSSRSTRIVCIIDACYSGAANLPSSSMIDKGAAEGDAESALATYDEIFDVPKAKGKCLLLSSQAYEISEAIENSNSRYTKHLIVGLRGTKATTDDKGRKIPASVDEDGNVTPETLHEFVYHKVASEVNQTPKIKSDKSSKIVIVTHQELARVSEMLLKLLQQGKIKEFNNIRKRDIKKPVNLHEMFLNGANLNGVDLVGANLQKAKMVHSHLSESCLTGANLNGADLSAAYLNKSNLSAAKLSYVNFHGAKLWGADLSGSDLHHARLSNADLSNADLSHAFIADAILFRANLSNADLSNADLSGAKLTNVINLPIPIDEAKKRGAII